MIKNRRMPHERRNQPTAFVLFSKLSIFKKINGIADTKAPALSFRFQFNFQYHCTNGISILTVLELLFF